MDLSNIKPAKGAVHRSKRIGRGQGSGYGGTSTRGHKGAQSRSGYSQRFGFEGGQMPIQRRLPKRGFKNFNREEYSSLNLDRLQQIIDKLKLKKIDLDTLIENRVIRKNEKIKILGRGELKTKVDVSAHAFSETAKKAIEALGGTVNQI